MTTALQTISHLTEKAFTDAGFDPAFARVTVSDRPDLSDYQCNGAMKARGATGKNPREIAESIREKMLAHDAVFETITVDGPGFLNMRVRDEFIREMLFKSGGKIEQTANPEKIVIDYGGPNVAKPLHVGHLRSAIIGEAIKRTGRMLGHTVIGDIHMGDWGTPMGMLIAQLEDTNPDWPYFADDFKPSSATEQPPFPVEELNELYPQASKRSKEDPAFAEAARLATAKLQAGHAGYRALWKHFLNLSIASIKGDFSQLNVEFDLWLGESDADPVIEGMVEDLKTRGIAYEDKGALIIDVAREGDKFEMAPLMLRKSDGAATYGTTDLATIYQRVEDRALSRILYVVDQRQSLHFQQLFRAAGRAGYIAEDHLEHAGFGTMNGKDGKPFKTREGGVMRLSDLIGMARDLALQTSGFTNEEARAQGIENMVSDIATAAIKFGDLSNPRTSDYIFNPEEFVRFEGKTGPYIQYTAVRARAILAKLDGAPSLIAPLAHKTERDLGVLLLGFSEAVSDSFAKRMPSELCDYTYRLAKAFNGFYKDCPVAAENDPAIRATRHALTAMTLSTLEQAFAALAIPLPERMVRKEMAEAA